MLFLFLFLIIAIAVYEKTKYIDDQSDERYHQTDFRP